MAFSYLFCRLKNHISWSFFGCTISKWPQAGQQSLWCPATWKCETLDLQLLRFPQDAYWLLCIHMVINPLCWSTKRRSFMPWNQARWSHRSPSSRRTIPFSGGQSAGNHSWSVCPYFTPPSHQHSASQDTKERNGNSWESHCVQEYLGGKVWTLFKYFLH